MATLRKAQTDGKQLQRRISVCAKFEDADIENASPMYVSNWRIKPDVTYYYQWEKINTNNDSIMTSQSITDERAKETEYSEGGWRRIDSSKRTWEE